jgi:bacterioferritin (cytochrome b1)
MRGENMEQTEIQEKIMAYLEKMKGKKKLKEKDIIKKIVADTEEEKDTVKTALRAMINVGKLMYSYAGGASSVEIPSEEYLREKGML